MRFIHYCYYYYYNYVQRISVIISKDTQRKTHHAFVIINVSVCTLKVLYITFQHRLHFNFHSDAHDYIQLRLENVIKNSLGVIKHSGSLSSASDSEQVHVFQSTFIMLPYTLVLPQHSLNQTSTLYKQHTLNI